MFGPDISDPEMCGIIPRACKNIFDHIRSNNTENIEFSVRCSFLEIYKEIVRDLLNPSKVNLKVRDAPGKGVWVCYFRYDWPDQDLYGIRLKVSLSTM